MLDYDGWLARNMLAQMARHNPAINAVHAAGTEWNDESNRLVFVKIRDAVCGRGADGQGF